MQRRGETPELYDIPAQKLFDQISSLISRQDALNAATLKAISQLSDVMRINAGNGGSTIPTPFLIPQKGQLESAQFLPYAIRSIDLTAAMNDYLVTEEGWNLIAVSDGLMDSIIIKLNNKDANNLAIPMKYMKVTRQPFSRLYITSPAQAAKTLYLGISKLEGYALDLNDQSIPGSVSGGSQTIFNQGFATIPIGTYFTTMVDLRFLKKVSLKAVSTLDVPCTVQVIGNILDSAITAGEEGPVIPLPAADSVVVGVVDGYCFPYVGMEIVLAANPTAGSLIIYAVPQG